MKQIIPKWRLIETTVSHNGVIDKEYSGYDLQKNGIAIVKFGYESLAELKTFFSELDLEKYKH